MRNIKQSIAFIDASTASQCNGQNSLNCREKIIATLKTFFALARQQKNIHNKLNLYQFIASCYWHNYSATYSHPEL